MIATKATDKVEHSGTISDEAEGVKTSRPPLIPTPDTDATGRAPLVIKFMVGKEYMRRVNIPHWDGRKKAVQVIHLYPTLEDWIGRIIPDTVNPRSHDAECLRSPVARKIEETVLESPEDFVFANRGSTIIAESLGFNTTTGEVTITISDLKNQGMADGATTDAVIAKVQTNLAREILEDPKATYADLLRETSNRPDLLRKARIHLEVIVGLDERERIANLVEGRNTSRQVRGWSISDFRGEFDWIKDILEKDGSPFKGRIGYEENNSEPVSVLEVISLLTLFHPALDEERGKDRSPVMAYSNKGRMNSLLIDPAMQAGYRQLAPLLPDILVLHDYIYSHFEEVYGKAVIGGRASLGKRQSVHSRLKGEPLVLPLTGRTSNYELPAGFIYPLLAAFRALVQRRGGRSSWCTDPHVFFDKHGKRLMHELIDQLEELGGNSHYLGRQRLAYNAIHTQALLALHK